MFENLHNFDVVHRIKDILSLRKEEYTCVIKVS